jgi:hypothetical protein
MCVLGFCIRYFHQIWAKQAGMAKQKLAGETRWYTDKMELGVGAFSTGSYITGDPIIEEV